MIRGWAVVVCAKLYFATTFDSKFWGWKYLIYLWFPLEELSWKCVIWWIALSITENMSVLGQGNKYRRKLGRNLVNKLSLPAVSPINAFQIHSQFLPILSFCQKFLPIPFTVSAVSYFLSLILSLFHKLFLQLLHIPIPSFFHKFFLTPSSFFH